MRAIHHWIDGQEAPGKSGRTADVFNPATGEVQARVDLATKAEVDAAIERAAEAGADVFVAGSAVFGAEDPDAAVDGLRRAAARACC